MYCKGISRLYQGNKAHHVPLSLKLYRVFGYFHCFKLLPTASVIETLLVTCTLISPLCKTKLKKILRFLLKTCISVWKMILLERHIKWKCASLHCKSQCTSFLLIDLSTTFRCSKAKPPLTDTAVQNPFLKLHSGSWKKVGIAYGQCKNKKIILGRDIRMSLMKATPSLPRKLLVYVVRHRGFQAKA